ESVVPAVRALDDPAPGLTAARPGRRRLAATRDMRRDVALAKPTPDLRVVVPFVERAVAWAARSPGRRADDGGGDGVERQRPVGAVGAGDHDGDGHARPVGHYAAFRARFRAIGRVRTRQVPPLGAFTIAVSSALQSRSRPLRSS